MQTTTNYTVNEQGLAEIKTFLAAYHKLGGDHFTPTMLRAWAEKAEFQLGEGNPPLIEINSWDSVTWHVEQYCISDAGLDAHVVEIDE